MLQRNLTEKEKGPEKPNKKANHSDGMLVCRYRRLHQIPVRTEERQTYRTLLKAQPQAF